MNKKGISLLEVLLTVLLLAVISAFIIPSFIYAMKIMKRNATACSEILRMEDNLDRQIEKDFFYAPLSNQ